MTELFIPTNVKMGKSMAQGGLFFTQNEEPRKRPNWGRQFGGGRGEGQYHFQTFQLWFCL